jgi:putative SOS response-associated peptidase YedK
MNILPAAPDGASVQVSTKAGALQIQSATIIQARACRQAQELTERGCALCSSAGWQRWLASRGRVGLRRYSVLISGRFRQ